MIVSALLTLLRNGMIRVETLIIKTKNHPLEAFLSYKTYITYATTIILSEKNKQNQFLILL